MLKESIGSNAGLIWNILKQGELNIKSIKKLTKLSDKDLYFSLGWLAREGKINFSEIEGDLFISLAE
jgi:hypothetical protein